MRDNGRVCVLTVRHPANDDRIYYKQVLSLKKRYKILLIAPTKGAQQVGQDESLEYQPAERGIGMVRRIRVLLDAYRLLKRAKPDICHFHDYEVLGLVPLLRLTTRIRLIYDAHEMHRESVLDREGNSSMIRRAEAWVRHAFEGWTARMCHHVVAADDGVRDGLGRLPVPVTVINNFPRVDLFCVRDDLRQDLNRRYAGRFVCLYQGGMSSTRGLFHMVRAADRVRRRHPEFMLLLVGDVDPSLRAEAEAMVSQLGLQKHVEFIGEVPHLDVPTYMNVAKVGLVPFLPTRKLMMQPSIKLFEYMICGVPIVASDLSTNAQFVGSAGCGVLYPAGNDRALADAIVGLLEAEATRKEMGARGYAAVRSLWSWDQMERRLFDVYETLQVSTSSADH